jgi:hypothetical protein
VVTGPGDVTGYGSMSEGKLHGEVPGARYPEPPQAAVHDEALVLACFPPQHGRRLIGRSVVEGDDGQPSTFLCEQRLDCLYEV